MSATVLVVDGGRARAGGSGIGPAVVARLVQAHGGDVEVLGVPGDGARFDVRLPARSVEHPLTAAGHSWDLHTTSLPSMSVAVGGSGRRVRPADPQAQGPS